MHTLNDILKDLPETKSEIESFCIMMRPEMRNMKRVDIIQLYHKRIEQMESLIKEMKSEVAEAIVRKTEESYVNQTYYRSIDNTVK